MFENQTADPILDEDGLNAETVTATPEKSARELAIEAIADANLRRLELESNVKLTDTATTSSVDQEQLAAQLSDDVISDPRDKRVRIKVDGVEQDVPLADVVRSYQIGSAADKRLQEATRILNEAKAQAPQAAPAPAQEPAPAPEPITVNPPVAVESRVREAFEKLFEGDSDAAVKAMSQLITESQGGQQPTQAPVSIDQIAEQLQQRLAVDTAFATIQRDYPDVIANKDIELLTAIKVNQKIAEGASRASAMLDSAKEVYETLGRPIPGRQPEKQSESRSEKLRLKAGMDRIPVANMSAAQTDEASQYVDASSVIQEIANRRMGQSLVVPRR